MPKNLLIVESPAKAKTIEKYLGEDFRVQASMGHIRDLPKSDLSVDIEKGFEPAYEVPADKMQVVNNLKRLAEQSDAVWLATDEDREGEAISWHLLEVLGLDLQSTKRIVFHEITKPAILKAVQNPRTINLDLVEAQQARRILDRLVGYEISPILWKKVKYGLSAGRVQSVAVRLIVEREREVLNHAYQSYFRVKAEMKTQAGKPFKAELVERLNAKTEARQYLDHCVNATFTVAKLEKKPAKRTPSAPFTTSTLQQEASRKLYFSVSRTMRLAQTLYENGFITYMRTDSVSFSEQALQSAAQTITDKFGKRYHQTRRYKNKVANAQEAHEAIRPTDFNMTSVPMDADAQRLYELIWKRALASQMADAELERTIVDIDVLSPTGPNPMKPLRAEGEVILFDGFLKLYIEGKDEDEKEGDTQGLLPTMAVGETLQLVHMMAEEDLTRPAARYTEASLVKKLEELGIGRPSTYAPTIGTIQDRNYVVKEDRPGKERQLFVITLVNDKVSEQQVTKVIGTEKSKLFPTDLGMLVTDFLVANFKDIVDYSFTAKVEEDFDEIANGKVRWSQMLQNFYPSFHHQVLETEQKAERIQGERVLGTDPKSGKPVVARFGRYGPLAQIGNQEDEQKRFASLLPNQRLETITLEEALDLFNLPRLIGDFEGHEMKANIGRFGPYILHNSKFYSIPKPHDAFSIDEADAEEIILKKREADLARILKTFDGTHYQIIKGRWGPYLAAGAESVKIPKGVEIEAITVDQCKEWEAAHLATAKPAKGKRGAASNTKVKAGSAKSTDKATKKSATKTPASSATNESITVKPRKAAANKENAVAAEKVKKPTRKPKA